ncbi:3-hydroxyacyl-CoA dehydrogenase NAD-binding domain-containing protein [Ottowia caeni]|uniref:3-hydroxyacyl-CoA dehydrogenase n=1 Tax=Ottowia caeni TaxID=2870339 RepID=UPI003D74BC3E
MRLQHAPERIIESVEVAVRLPLEEGLEFEREQFMRCARHPQAKALQHRFFAERQASVVPGLATGVQPRTVTKGAVIGAGTMGRGIAMCFANAGVPVVLMDGSPPALEQALDLIRKTYEGSVKRGRLSAEDLEHRMSLIQTSLSYDALRDADFIVEAVFELMSVKKTVFAEIDKVAPPGAVLASNTSFLSIDEIASATSRPGDVVGTHFFAPANVMRLLEIVRGDTATSDEALVTALSLAKSMGKIAVVAGNSYGFIGNRMVNAYLHQADLLLLEGAQPEQIDRALVDFGMAMGPLQMRDLSGFSGVAKSRRARGLEHFDPRSLPVIERLIEQGRHGQKTLAGYYDYEPQSRDGKPSAVVQQLISDVAQELGIERRSMTDEEIVERCLLAMANIGMDILAERVAIRASDIDVVYLNGYGFPAHQGGPMHWLEHEVGLAKGLEKLKALSAHVGERWLRPSPLLEQLVARGEGLPK